MKAASRGLSCLLGGLDELAVFNDDPHLPK